MKNKRLISIVLAVVMLLSFSACGAASAPSAAPQATAAPSETQTQPEMTPETTSETPAAGTAGQPAPAKEATALSDIDKQLVLIHSQIDKLEQKEGELPWFYTVTDLDHDGCLEFVAASQHPQDRSTNLKIWEVSNDRSSLTECSVKKDEDESFPDIMADSIDTYHDTASDTWNYAFYDNVVLSDTEVYTSRSAFSLKNGEIAYDAFAVEHTLVENGVRTVSHTDAEGNEITADEYKKAADKAFEGCEKSNTSFDWLTAEDAKVLTRVTDSFMVFMGMKKAPENFPVPAPAAFLYPEAAPETPAPTPAPAPAPEPAPTPAPQPTYLMITKNPTNENKKVGGTALFVACANAFDWLEWTIVGPDGYEYTPSQFAYYFPNSAISGYYGTTLSIANVSADLNAWGAYCTFYYGGQVASTSTAYLYVSGPAPTPVPKGGVYYGNVSDWNYSTVSFNLGYDGYIALNWNICEVDGDIYVGAPATLYWDGYVNGDKNFYYVSIEGEHHEVGPIYGSMSGIAHEGGGGFAIDLMNGTQVFVDAWRCNVSGQFVDGCTAIVYYMNYPSNDNIYQADIYGIDDYGGQGGWAGANYYDNETGNAVPVDGGNLPTHIGYNPDGSTYEAIWCPDCGAEVSLAMEQCPNCGRWF